MGRQPNNIAVGSKEEGLSTLTVSTSLFPFFGGLPGFVIVSKYVLLGKITCDSQNSKMTLNNPQPCIIPFSLSVGGTCKYYITPVIIYVIRPKKDWGGWSRLPQVIPLKAQHFLWVVTEKEPSETCACWTGRKQTAVLCCGLAESNYQRRKVASSC